MLWELYRKRFEENRGNRKLCHLNPFEFLDHTGWIMELRDSPPHGLCRQCTCTIDARICRIVPYFCRTLRICKRPGALWARFRIR